MEPVAPVVVTQSYDAPAKRQITDTQRANLAKAREKAREARFAKARELGPDTNKAGDIKAELSPVKEEPASVQEPKDEAEPVKEDSDTTMSSSESELESSPEPSPVKVDKKKKNKRVRFDPLSDEDSSEDDAQDAAARKIDHAALAKAAYQRQLDLYKQDMVYKNIFSYL